MKKENYVVRIFLIKSHNHLIYYKGYSDNTS